MKQDTNPRKTAAITQLGVAALCFVAVATASTPQDSVATYQKQLAQQAATAGALIEDNREILSESCLVQVETLWRGMRNAYSSTGGQLPLYGVPFDSGSPELKGYVAALVDQGHKDSLKTEALVRTRCGDSEGSL